jgi:HAD superfamily hydrolase (TIGR01484 family)
MSETVIALHGLDSRAAAVDFESKCVEAGLANIQLADFRNFAHGRHHWLAKRPHTSVIAFVTPSDRVLADRTLRLLPKELSVTRIDLVRAGPLGAIEALAFVFSLVSAMGAAKGIDPGQPGVPDFGSKIYSLDAIKSAAKKPAKATAHLSLGPAVRRKARASIETLTASGGFERWAHAHSIAIDLLRNSEYSAVIFDYDGTILEKGRQWLGPAEETAEILINLLDAGIPVGIATGRGRSAGKDLRSSLPARLWKRILIAYYNGGTVASLSDESQPVRDAPMRIELQPILAKINENVELQLAAAITVRESQITIEPNKSARQSFVWDLVSGLIGATDLPGVRIVRSSHSIDILAPGISKTRLIDRMKSEFDLPSELEILAVGDRGQWPGNDAELLSGLHALSVDECSADPSHAWNMFPAGVRGICGTHRLCKSLKVTERMTLRIDVEALTGKTG